MSRIIIETDFELDLKQQAQATEVFIALIKTGGLWGVKSGSTNIHFSEDGTFMGIRFDYWPWKRRSLTKS